MDENGDIYSTDFVFITNMGDNIIVDEDEADEEEEQWKALVSPSIHN